MKSLSDAARRLDSPMDRRQLLKLGGLGALTLPAASWLAACGGGGAAKVAAGKAQRGGTLRFGMGLEPTSFDIATVSDSAAIVALLNIYDQLVTVRVDGEGVEPALAESWDVSADGRRYRFKLRPDVVFSDGRPMTVDDVVFSLRRAVDPKADAYGFLFTSVKDVRADGSGAVVVDLHEPSPSLLSSLCLFKASIVPRAAWEKDHGKTLGRNPIGTGPFVLKRFARGSVVELARNPRHWRHGAPLLDGVSLELVPDDNARLLKLQGKGLDAAMPLPYAQASSIEAQPGLSVLRQQTWQYACIVMNTKRAPFDDVHVRRALNYATDKEAVVKAVTSGQAEVAGSMMPKVQYWDASLKPYPFDLARAKAELQRSKVPDGFTFTMLIANSNSDQKSIAQIVQQTWGKIGVKVEISEVDAAIAADATHNLKFDARPQTLGSDVAAPDEMVGLEFDPKGGISSFFTSYSNPTVLGLLKTAAAATSDAARRDAFTRIQRIAWADAPQVPLFYAPQLVAVNDRVQGLATPPSGNFQFWKTSLASA